MAGRSVHLSTLFFLQQALSSDAYLDQIVTQPTRITETTSKILELFFTTNATLINKVETIPGISGHEAVFIESSLRPMKVKTPPRKVFQYKKADYTGMKSDLRAYQHEFEDYAETEDVECLHLQKEDTFPHGQIHSL